MLVEDCAGQRVCWLVCLQAGLHYTSALLHYYQADLHYYTTTTATGASAAAPGSAAARATCCTPPQEAPPNWHYIGNNLQQLLQCNIHLTAAATAHLKSSDLSVSPEIKNTRKLFTA